MYFSGEPAQIAEIKRLASDAVTPLYRRATNEGIQQKTAENPRPVRAGRKGGKALRALKK
ncbi:hypothetical protein CAA07_005121 [Escherichia coli]|nr:hypothetical protein [Escherichia coli]